MPRRPPIHRPTVLPVPYAATRLGTSARGYDRTWERLRRIVLADEPLCRFCLAEGILTPAHDVDHIVPIAQRPDLRLERSNLRPLCAPCHGRHTRKEHAA